MTANETLPSKKRGKSSAKEKWTKALEKITQMSSEPWLRPTLSEYLSEEAKSLSCTAPVLSSSAKPDLKSILSLSECMVLLQKLSEEVNNINKVKRGSKQPAAAGSSREPDSLESSRSLILSWAKELEMNMVNKKTRLMNVKTKRMEKTEEEKLNDKLLQWAVELRDIKDAYGVSNQELKKLLYPQGSNKARIAAILPLLEFVAWSLLAEDTEEAVPMMWLPSKQKAWRTGSGNPKYIPKSVWQWIQSAAVPFQLDVSSCHPWLSVSSDRLQLSEAENPPTLSDSKVVPKHPIVLGDVILSKGRHYWEVDVSSEGSWRIGVMSQFALTSKKPSPVSPKGGFWTLWKASSFWACADTSISLERATVPQRIGVYVDMMEGQVSFYDVDRRVHIYTFSDSFKHSLVPVFGWLDGDVLLRIKAADPPVSRM